MDFNRISIYAVDRKIEPDYKEGKFTLKGIKYMYFIPFIVNLPVRAIVALLYVEEVENDCNDRRFGRTIHLSCPS